ncbi:MAG TPA: hypothetical protein VHO95_13190 [Candidatus Dormibacteraeota bacterium]|nr:hypothetical protein [Candidatus Dormibacteraeota bacterium]HEX2680132.1 hypothetical protein [Candidatus Dormibacteraeota bacterium]
MSTIAARNKVASAAPRSVEMIRAASPVTDQPVIESFRLLALNVNSLLTEQNDRSVVLISARADAGRSLVAASLAAALAEVCHRVLLVKADPIGADNGFERFLDESSIGPGWLRVVDCSSHAKRSHAAFMWHIFDTVAEGLAQQATVVVDPPACTASTVAFQLAPRMGGVLYLARRQIEDVSIHHDIRAQLDLLGARVLGVVFNEA